jgi:hypothetical protein
MITEKKELDLLGKYRKAGYIVSLIKLCPHCGKEISFVVGGKKKKKGGK